MFAGWLSIVYLHMWFVVVVVVVRGDDHFCFSFVCSLIVCVCDLALVAFHSFVFCSAPRCQFMSSLHSQTPKSPRRFRMVINQFEARNVNKYVCMFEFVYALATSLPLHFTIYVLYTSDFFPGMQFDIGFFFFASLPLYMITGHEGTLAYNSF